MKQAFEVKDKALLEAAELILAEVKAIGAMRARPGVTAAR
jgi:hypothetical protein